MRQTEPPGAPAPPLPGPMLTERTVGASWILITVKSLQCLQGPGPGAESPGIPETSAA